MSKETTVQEFSADEVVTPTKLAEEVGVPPQMIYSYLSAGRIEGTVGKLEDSDRVQKLILRETADAWIQQYRERKAAREEKANEATTEELLEGVDQE